LDQVCQVAVFTVLEHKVQILVIHGHSNQLDDEWMLQFVQQISLPENGSGLSQLLD
jgi:hypothetical protein